MYKCVSAEQVVLAQEHKFWSVLACCVLPLTSVRFSRALGVCLFMFKLVSHSQTSVYINWISVSLEYDFFPSFQSLAQGIVALICLFSFYTSVFSCCCDWKMGHPWMNSYELPLLEKLLAWEILVVGAILKSSWQLLVTLFHNYLCFCLALLKCCSSMYEKAFKTRYNLRFQVFGFFPNKTLMSQQLKLRSSVAWSVWHLHW